MARYPQAVLVSCEIPWDEREQLIESAFREEIRQTLARGFRQFLMRSIDKVSGEWSLLCTAHNILKLARRNQRAYALA